MEVGKRNSQSLSKSISPKKDTLFIAGTDTEVGKTFVSILIIKGMKKFNVNVIPYKPVETGMSKFKDSDSFKLSSATGGLVNGDEINIYRFREPVAPSLAERMHSVKISLMEILNRAKDLKCRGDILLIEGAGGILSPLSSFEWSDVIKELRACVILVIGNKLGCINHSALTERYLFSKRIHLLGWIMNNPEKKSSLAQRENLNLLKQTLKSNFIAEIPYNPRPYPVIEKKLAERILYIAGNLLKHSRSSGMKG